MALSGGISVEFGDVFPHGCWMEGDVRPVKDFQRSVRKTDSNPGQDVQQVHRDKSSGEPVLADGQPVLVWEIDIYDPDPDAYEKRLKVKVFSPRQPVPPAPLEGSPFRNIMLTGLTVTPWVNQQTCRGPERDGERHRCRARQAYSLRATGLAGVDTQSAPARRPAAA